MSETNGLIDKINEICPNGRSNRHSFFQLQYFVVGKEPTVQAKLHACKRELLARKDDIEALVMAMDDIYDKIRLQQLEIEAIRAISEEDSDRVKESKQIEIRQLRRRLQALDHQVQDLAVTLRAKEDEANFLIGLYEKLAAIEAEKDWDSLEVQAEYWNAKLTREIESRLMLGELPNIEDFKTVLSLPPGMPIKDTTLKLIENRKNQAREMLNRAEKPTSNGT